MSASSILSVIPNAAPIGATTFDASAQGAGEGTVEGGETFEAMVMTASASPTGEDTPEQPTSIRPAAPSAELAGITATRFKPSASLVPPLHILPVEGETIVAEPVTLPRAAMDGVMPITKAEIIPLSAEPETSETDEVEASFAGETQPVIATTLQATPAVVEAVEVVADAAVDAPLEGGKPAATVRPLDALLAAKILEAANDEQAPSQDGETPAAAPLQTNGKDTAQNQDAARNIERARAADAAVRSAQSLQPGMEINTPRPSKDQAANTYSELKAVPTKSADGQSNAAAMRADTGTEALAAKAERSDNAKTDIAPAVADKTNGKDALKTVETKPAAPAPVSFETTDTANAGSADAVTLAPETAAQAEQRSAHSQLSLSNVRTTAEISAHILTKLGQRIARFDMVLTPETMGSVDVSMEVGADGELKARMVFDTPGAANEMRARAEELRRQLAESGFNVSENALEFTDRESDQRGGFQNFLSDGRSGRRAFAGGSRLAEEADAPQPVWQTLSLAPAGVDMKV